MFEEIEKSYRSHCPDTKFFSFYWKLATISMAILFLVNSIIGGNTFFVFFFYIAILFVAPSFSMIRNFLKTIRPVKDKLTLREKLLLHETLSRHTSILFLVESLMEHNINTKDRLKIVIDRYDSQCPARNQVNYIEWLTAVLLGIFSILEICYDQTSNVIDTTKLFTLVILSLIIFMTPFLFLATFKIASVTLMFRNQIYHRIRDDLIFIYINFDYYKASFHKSNNAHQPPHPKHRL